MKQVKKVLYVMGAILVPVVLSFLFTFIVMLIMMGTSPKLGFAIPEDMLYHMSGGLGTLLTALACLWHLFYGMLQKRDMGAIPQTN